MRKVLKFAAATTCLVLGLTMPISAQTPATPAPPPTKVGYIDTQRVIREAPGATEVQATLQKEMLGYQTKLKAMEDSLQFMIGQYQSQSVLLSADAKKQKEDEIRAKQGTWQERAQALQDSASKRQQTLMQPIMDKVQTAISDLRKAENYAIIFDMASEAMVAADPALDLTSKVIDRLKAAAPAAAAKK